MFGKMSTGEIIIISGVAFVVVGAITFSFFHKKRLFNNVDKNSFKKVKTLEDGSSLYYNEGTKKYKVINGNNEITLEEYKGEWDERLFRN